MPEVEDSSSPSAADELFTQHRGELFGIAYRMLGQVSDAEDLVQEAFLRWHNQDLAGIKSPRAWLVSTATRLCIDRLRTAQVRREQYVGVWLPEPLVGADPHTGRDQAALADSLSMAFMLMLDALTPVDRAVFLLREAFDYDYAEIAAVVERSEAACRQIVSRAKRTLSRPLPDDLPPPQQAQHLVQQFLTASRSGELRDLLALLTDDAVLYSDGGGVAAAARRPIHTADRVGRFFVGIRRFAHSEPETRVVSVNGRPGAVVSFGGRVDRVISFDFSGGRVSRIYIVRNPEKLVNVARASAR